MARELYQLLVVDCLDCPSYSIDKETLTPAFLPAISRRERIELAIIPFLPITFPLSSSATVTCSMSLFPTTSSSMDTSLGLSTKDLMI